MNWCPKCATVLANEQVVDGCCWRHEDTPVEQRALEQWFLKITAYADELLDDMAQLEGGWPERVLTMQRNWIGRSEGAEVDFHLDGTGEPIRVFTTRVDTIYGATCVILAPEHPLDETPARCRRQGAGQGHGRCARQQRSRRYRKGRLLHRPLRRQSLQRREGPDLGRQLRADGLRHRRHHGRARARRARFRILPQVRHRRPPGDPPVDGELARGARHDGALRRLRHRRELAASGPACPATKRAAQMAAYAEQQGFGKAADHLSASRIGASRASATGARRFR